MAKQKTKYPLDRAKTSQAFAKGEVSVDIMKTHPRVIITIGGEHSDDLVSDIMNGVDEALKFHEAK